MESLLLQVLTIPYIVYKEVLYQMELFRELIQCIFQRTEEKPEIIILIVNITLLVVKPFFVILMPGFIMVIMVGEKLDCITNSGIVHDDSIE